MMVFITDRRLRWFGSGDFAIGLVVY
jgi:uncharacterized protein YjeT (DUF2065 family)